MNLEFLPLKFVQALSNCDINLVYEIRLRTNYPVKILYDGKFCYLRDSGVSLFNKGLICEKEDIVQIVENLTKCSVYAYNDKIKQGFLTSDDGVRVGISGECVYSDGKIVTIKNIKSINIRIPHDILDCSKEIFPYVQKDNVVFNTLILSPPTCGKTTILKDITRKLDNKNIGSILLIDERGEFLSVRGENIDDISFSNKTYAFDCGIRSMSPQIVITDELCSLEDWEYAQNAVSCGINIFASCHAGSLNDLIKKKFFINNIFERYVVLKNNGVGVIEGVFDGEFNKLV